MNSSTDTNFQAFLQSGRKIILDTKAKKTTTTAVKKLAVPKVEDSGDPHKNFCKHVIAEKPKPKYLVEFFEDIIQREEAKL